MAFGAQGNGANMINILQLPFRKVMKNGFLPFQGKKHYFLNSGLEKSIFHIKVN